MNAPLLEKIVALCKRRGFIFQSAELYGGLNGIYDFGPLGTLMKQSVRRLWSKHITKNHNHIEFFEGAILGPHDMWQASGHIDGFNDPMVDCQTCKKRYRADDPDISLEKPCPHCGNTTWTEPRQFNMMFSTQLGAASSHASIAYLRPETAQSIFVNFKQVMTTSRAKIPFGIAQVGKAFRNEITPKQFLFRTREFEQMELEWFCKEEEAPSYLNFWKQYHLDFCTSLGLDKKKLRFHRQSEQERAHYSKDCFDIEYDFPFGWKELAGIAHRGDYDLSMHIQKSGKDLAVFDDTTKSSYIPNVVESSMGTDRLILALLSNAYTEDVVDNESRVVLKLHPSVAPIKAALLPLTKKQSEECKAIFYTLKEAGISIDFDESGSIGKRYRRQDEIGTPFCFTYDFETENDNCVTVRDRDTTEQKRIPCDQILSYITNALTL